MTQQERIRFGLAELLVGESKDLTMVAALSIACSTARVLRIPKLELQKMLMRMFDRHESEERQETRVDYNVSDFNESEERWVAAFWEQGK